MRFEVESNGRNILHRLRSICVLVIHPDDEDRRTLLSHLLRIGCQVECVWPSPKDIKSDYDVVLFLLDQPGTNSQFSWMTSNNSIARIALVLYETPEFVSELDRLKVHGVLTKPIRIFGILAALTTAMGIAHHEKRLKKRIETLDETLRSRRKIEKAVGILVKTRNISEPDAYRRLREKSMNSKSSIVKIAEAIIEAHDL